MPKVEARITWGNIAIFLQLLLMGWGAAAAYTTLSNAVAEAGTQVEDHEQRLRNLEALAIDKLGRIDERLAAIEGRLP